MNIEIIDRTGLYATNAACMHASVFL